MEPKETPEEQHRRERREAYLATLEARKKVRRRMRMLHRLRRHELVRLVAKDWSPRRLRKVFERPVKLKQLSNVALRTMLVTGQPPRPAVVWDR